MNPFLAGDLSQAVLDNVTSLGPEYLAVGVGAIAIGLIPFGLRRVWGLGKSLSK